MTAQKKAQKKYEKTKRGELILKINLSSSDDSEEWEKIKNWLVKKGDGTAKQGLYKLAKENGVIK